MLEVVVSGLVTGLAIAVPIVLGAAIGWLGVLSADWSEELMEARRERALTPSLT